MSLQVIAVLLAVAVLVGYAISRVLRVRAGLESRPVGSRLVLLLLAVACTDEPEEPADAETGQAASAADPTLDPLDMVRGRV